MKGAAGTMAAVALAFLAASACAQTTDTVPLHYQQVQAAPMTAPLATTGSVSLSFENEDEISDCGWPHPFDYESAVTGRVDEVVGCAQFAQPYDEYGVQTCDVCAQSTLLDESDEIYFNQAIADTLDLLKSEADSGTGGKSECNDTYCP